MKNLEAWRNISLKIIQFLNHNSIKTLNLSLVGSQAMENKPNSDLDSILIIDADSNDSELIAIRQSIDEFLIAESCEAKYHYKLFNKSHFELFASYDGFRLAKFKRNHLQLFDSDFLINSKPCLDEVNFINSILIQIVYEFMNSLPLTSTHSYFDILTKWIKINQTYNPNFQVELDDDTLKYFRNNDTFFSFFFETFINAESVSEKSIISFLLDYYKRIPHELINKSHNYSLLIKNRINNG